MKINLKSLRDMIEVYEDKFNNSNTKNEKLMYFNSLINELNTSSSALIQMRNQIDNLPKDPEQISQ